MQVISNLPVWSLSRPLKKDCWYCECWVKFLLFLVEFFHFFAVLFIFYFTLYPQLATFFIFKLNLGCLFIDSRESVPTFHYVLAQWLKDWPTTFKRYRQILLSIRHHLPRYKAYALYCSPGIKKQISKVIQFGLIVSFHSFEE